MLGAVLLAAGVGLLRSEIGPALVLSFYGSVLILAGILARMEGLPFPISLVPAEAEDDRRKGERGAGVEVGPQDIFCSGVGEGEQFIDTDGTQKNAVVLPRRRGWPSVPGAEYVWARALPSEEEARKGCTAYLIRTVRLARDPRSGVLSLRVDDEADVSANGAEVKRGLKGSYRYAHRVDVTSYLKQGDNELRLAVHNYPMDRPEIRPEDNPTGIAYRLEVSY